MLYLIVKSPISGDITGLYGPFETISSAMAFGDKYLSGWSLKVLRPILPDDMKQYA